MAEAADNTTVTGGEDGTGQPPAPQFALQRIYLKDCSFESPRSPKVFQQQWQPHVNFDIKTRSEQVQDDVYQVILSLTVEAKLEEQSAFLAEVHQAGIFTLKNFTAVQREPILAAVCPNILFPYARESIDTLVVKGSFPALMLAPVNFDMLYQQKKQQQAQAAQATHETPAADAVQ